MLFETDQLKSASQEGRPNSVLGWRAMKLCSALLTFRSRSAPNRTGNYVAIFLLQMAENVAREDRELSLDMAVCGSPTFTK